MIQKSNRIRNSEEELEQSTHTGIEVRRATLKGGGGCQVTQAGGVGG